MPPHAAAFILFSVRLAFALLVCNTAAGLASGLAGSLALAATAILCALAKILGFNSLNMLHDWTSKIYLLLNYSTYKIQCQ